MKDADRMLLVKLFPPSHIKPDLAARTKEELFEELIDFLCESQPCKDKDRLLAELWKRERMLNTVIAPSIALPHASIRGYKPPAGIFGVSHGGIDYKSEDGAPVRIVLMLIDDWYETQTHLMILRNASRMIGSPNFFSKIMGCRMAEEVHAIITEIDEVQYPW